MNAAAQTFPDLATAARTLSIGDMASFSAVHCDPLYNAGEQPTAWRFDVVQNDAEALTVRRQFRNNTIDLTAYRVAHRNHSIAWAEAGRAFRADMSA